MLAERQRGVVPAPWSISGASAVLFWLLEEGWGANGEVSHPCSCGGFVCALFNTNVR